MRNQAVLRDSQHFVPFDCEPRAFIEKESLLTEVSTDSAKNLTCTSEVLQDDIEWGNVES